MKTAAEKSVAVFGFVMRKKWLWLLVLPILLCGAVFRARGATLKKQESKFRLAMRLWMINIDHVEVNAEDPSSHQVVSGSWSKWELLRMLDDLHLQRAEPNLNFPRDVTLSLRFIDASHVNVPGVIDWSGFYLDLKKQRGFISLPNQNSFEHWENFELTPETCRMIKKRIFALQEKDGELFTPK